MKNRLLLSSSFLISLSVVAIITISLYQFDILSSNQNIIFDTPSNETNMDTDGEDETSSASKVISFFSFILNFSKSPN